MLLVYKIKPWFRRLFAKKETRDREEYVKRLKYALYSLKGQRYKERNSGEVTHIISTINELLDYYLYYNEQTIKPEQWLNKAMSVMADDITGKEFARIKVLYYWEKYKRVKGF